MDRRMRILTVRQPWAWAIIHGGKDVENRLRNIAGGYRGPIAIHAGLASFDDDDEFWEVRRAITSEINGWPAGDSEVWASDLVEPTDPRFIYGAIIGVVDLVEVTPWTSHTDAPTGTPGVVRRVPRQPARWEMRDHWHLHLANPRPLADPIPYTGALGLRDLAARDPETVLAINRQIGPTP